MKERIRQEKLDRVRRQLRLATIEQHRLQTNLTLTQFIIGGQKKIIEADGAIENAYLTVDEAKEQLPVNEQREKDLTTGLEACNERVAELHQRLRVLENDSDMLDSESPTGQLVEIVK